MFCTQCGQPNDGHSRYCSNCGRELDAIKENFTVSTVEAAYCGSCGEENPAGNLYCIKCGQSLDQLCTGRKSSETRTVVERVAPVEQKNAMAFKEPKKTGEKHGGRVKKYGLPAAVVLLAIIFFIVQGMDSLPLANQVNKVGNTPGNITNWGLAAQQGDWIYYVSIYEGDERVVPLYKIRTNGTERTKLSDEGGIFINVVDEWIYYTDSWQDGALYKIRTDGSGKTRLNDDESWYLNVVGEWIYYVNVDSWQQVAAVYKIRTDGTERTRLSGDVISDHRNSGLCVLEDWIYYTKKSDHSIYKMRLDGTGETKLNHEESYSINVADGWVYYVTISKDSDDHGNIYKIRTDGTGGTRLNQEPISYREVFSEGLFNVADGWVYYLNGENIYKMRTDGTEVSRVNDEYSACINVVGDWIYYYNDINGPYSSKIEDKTYKMRSDGTQNQLVD